MAEFLICNEREGSYTILDSRFEKGLAFDSAADFKRMRAGWDRIVVFEAIGEFKEGSINLTECEKQCRV